MSDNKLVKTITDALTITGLTAGIPWIANNVVKEYFTSEFISNVMNHAKFEPCEIHLGYGGKYCSVKQCLEDEKILLNSL